MRVFCMVVLAAAMLLAGCVNVPDRIDVNLNTGGKSSDGEKPARPAQDSSDEPSGSSAPSQLPASGGGGWREIATTVAGQVFLAAEQGVLFYAFDTLAYPGSPVDLAGRLQSVSDMKGIAGVTVGFYDGKELIGSAETDASGLAILKWTPPRVGNYRLTAAINALPDGAPRKILDVQPVPLLVAARAKDTRFVIVDLDHTVVDGSFFRVLVGGARPMADSVEVTKRIAEIYSIVYLTHRPDLLTRKSKQWLSGHGYPAGPLLVSELKEAFGDSGKFKTAKLKALRKAFGNISIGIGDKLSDAQAYVDNGLTAYLIPNYKQKPKSMRKMARSIRRLNDRGRLNVVDGWREVEAGIFRTRKFKPSTFAGRLERQAKQLEEEQKERKRKDKDDDDDDGDDDDDDD